MKNMRLVDFKKYCEKNWEKGYLFDYVNHIASEREVMLLYTQIQDALKYIYNKDFIYCQVSLMLFNKYIFDDLKYELYVELCYLSDKERKAIISNDKMLDLDDIYGERIMYEN